MLGKGAALGGESATVVALNGFTAEASSGDLYINNAGTVVRFGPFVASGTAEFGGVPGSSPEVERFGERRLAQLW